MSSIIKVLSWNINGIRSLKTKLKNIFDESGAHIICIQETKITRDQLEEDLAIIDGYDSFFNFSKKKSGYSGVATFCKKDAIPAFAQEGLSGTLGTGHLKNGCGNSESLPFLWDPKNLKDLDLEGRCIITQHPFQGENGEEKLLTVINVYCPRADPDRPERAIFKLAFYELLRQRVSVLTKAGSHVIIAGDLNTSHRRIDHCDPDDEEFDVRDDRMFLNLFINDGVKIKSDENQCSNSNLKFGVEGFLNSTSFVELNKYIFNCLEVSNSFEDCNERYMGENKIKVVDTFRYFHSEQKEAFTCWNTKVNARATNYGTRIDYVLCDEELLPFVHDSYIHPNVTGSDHCPVSVDLTKLKLLVNHPLPPSCTKFYPEFHGSQQKLSSYFKSGTSTNECDLGTYTFKATSYRGEKTEIENSKRKMQTEDKRGNNKKKPIMTKQTSLNSYFIKSTDSQKLESKASNYSSTLSGGEADIREEVLNQDISSINSQKTAEDCANFPKETSPSTDVNVNETQMYESISFSKSEKNNWSFLMRAPSPPPLCPGHKEPSVLRTVKKKGPNFNKQFYSCARGVGKEGDPNSRCNFFKWVLKKPR